MKRNNTIYFILFLLFWAFFFNTGCTQQQKDYKIGLCTTLTGPRSPIGIQQRNGALLAVEEINKNGGINGKQLSLIIRDDKGDISTALEMDKQLIELGVIAIVGHYMSTVATEVMPLMNKYKIPLISSGASASSLSYQDDYLIRMALPLDIKAVTMADYIIDDTDIRDLAMFMDSFNYVYSFPYSDYFKERFESRGGHIVYLKTSDNISEESIADIIADIKESGATGIISTLDAFSSALLYHHIINSRINITIFDTGGGTQTDDFVRFGGQAAEGVFSLDNFDYNSQEPAYIKYKKKYEERYNEKAASHDTTTYEGIYLLKELLLKNPQGDRLMETLKQMKYFKEVNSPITFDQYADPLRPLYIQQIRNSTLQVVKEIQPH
jgi:branched-chain amino acid transport system substrate-binding protein